MVQAYQRRKGEYWHTCTMRKIDGERYGNPTSRACHSGWGKRRPTISLAGALPKMHGLEISRSKRSPCHHHHHPHHQVKQIYRHLTTAFSTMPRMSTSTRRRNPPSRRAQQDPIQDIGQELLDRVDRQAQEQADANQSQVRR